MLFLDLYVLLLELNVLLFDNAIIRLFPILCMKNLEYRYY